MQTRYWQFHTRPIYRNGRACAYVATITSTIGMRRGRAYAMTLPTLDRNQAAADAGELMRLIFKLETDEGATP